VSRWLETLLAVVVSPWLATSAPAAANSTTRAAARVAWEPAADTSCIDPAELVAEVERRLQERVFAEGAEASFELRIGVVREEKGITARIALYDQDGRELGTRELESLRDDCSELRVLLPVVIAVLVDPHRQALLDGSPQPPVAADPARAPSRQDQEPAPATTSDSEPSEPEPSTSAASPKPPSLERGPVRCGVGAAGIFGFAPRSPSVALSFGCAAEVLGPLLLDVEFAYRLPRGSDESPGVVVSAAAGRGAVCAGWDVAESRLGPCAGLALARVEADVGGLRTDSDVRWGTEVWMLARVDRSLSEAGFVRLEAGGFVPLVRPIYTIESATGERTSLHQPAPWASVVQIGAGLILP
jgi:hypothetical protein